MLLIATGTGLAPLAGICRDALTHGHKGEIHLYHGARTADGFYLQDELRALQRAHANLHYTAVVPPDESVTTAALLRVRQSRRGGRH